MNLVNNTCKLIGLAARPARHTAIALSITGVLAFSVSGCTATRVFNRGAIINQDQLDLVPIGSSKEQVELALGSPSTTGTFDNEIYYYISQKAVKNYEFQKPKLVDQRVVAVYFGPDNTVTNVADYGLKNGQVFDFISRTTPTGGKDFSFLQQILTGKATPASVVRGSANRGSPVGK